MSWHGAAPHYGQSTVWGNLDLDRGEQEQEQEQERERERERDVQSHLGWQSGDCPVANTDLQHEAPTCVLRIFSERRILRM